MKTVKLGNENEESLNGDIMFDILSRIPAKPLLGMKCISRKWQTLISNRSFVKSQLLNADLVLDGFIVVDGYMLSRQDVKTVNYIPVESQNQEAPVVHHKVFSFLPEQVVVLSSCKGIVCCRSRLPSLKPTLYLCNPFIREWIQLNCSVSCHVTDSIALVFDFEPSIFKLVRVKRFEKINPHQEVWDEESESEEGSFFFTFELYSSETKTWRKSEETCDCNHDLIKNKGVYIGGVLHWLTEGDKIITFNVEKELCLLISVPVPASEFRSVPEACIGEHEGKLHYVQVSENGLHVWYLEDYFDFKWILKHCKSLEDFEQQYPRRFLNLNKRVSERVIMDSNPWMSPLGFQDGKSLIKVSSELYTYDMKSDKTAHACSFLQLNPQSMSPCTVFPHSLTLVSLNDA